MKVLKLLSSVVLALVTIFAPVQGRTIFYRVKGSAFRDAQFCYNGPYFNRGGEEKIGTFRDCVASQLVFFSDGSFQFDVITTFSPDDEEKGNLSELTTTCTVTVSPKNPADIEEGGYNANEECYNENGVVAGGTGSVSLLGVVDNTQAQITGELKFDLLWTIKLDN